MGEGRVLESGTHNDLIQAGGVYARLVQSQKLREGRERRSQLLDADNASEDFRHSMEKEVQEKIPLGRKNTEHSLASDILEQKRQAMGASGKNENEKDYDLPYLFRRMFLIIRDRWQNYFFGFVFACCACFIFRVYFFSHNEQSPEWYTRRLGLFSPKVFPASLSRITRTAATLETESHSGVYSQKANEPNCDLFLLGSSLSPSSPHCASLRKTIYSPLLLRCCPQGCAH